MGLVEQLKPVDREIGLLAKSDRRALFAQAVGPLPAFVHHRAQYPNHYPPLFHVYPAR